MSYTSNVAYSGINNQNSQRLKDIQKAEHIAKAYYGFLRVPTE